MSLDGWSVLLVEDDANDVLLFLKRAFDRVGLGTAPRSVTNVDEAITYMAGQGPFANRALHPPPSVVLLDLKLPGKSGFQFLEWIKAQPGHRRIPVIVLTSSRQEEDLRRAYDLGAAAFLVKPPGFDELLPLVRSTRSFWCDLAKFSEC
jgi:CheY-like chemotaxis protein